jgi:hypothetical protein
MLGILVRSILVLTVLLSSAWPPPASAITFLTPSDNTTDAFNLHNTTLAVGQVYTTNGFRFVDPGQSFDDYYSFTLTPVQLATTTLSALQANPGVNGPFGIAGLTAEWIGLGSTQAFTDANGVLNTTALLVSILTTSGPYFLHIFGRALAEGGSYGLLLRAASPVPLPPAVFLLGTVLVGLAIAGRRRRIARNQGGTRLQA